MAKNNLLIIQIVLSLTISAQQRWVLEQGCWVHKAYGGTTNGGTINLFVEEKNFNLPVIDYNKWLSEKSADNLSTNPGVFPFNSIYHPDKIINYSAFPSQIIIETHTTYHILTRWTNSNGVPLVKSGIVASNDNIITVNTAIKGYYGDIPTFYINSALFFQTEIIDSNGTTISKHVYTIKHSPNSIPTLFTSEFLEANGKNLFLIYGQTPSQTTFNGFMEIRQDGTIADTLFHFDFSNSNVSSQFIGHFFPFENKIIIVGASWQPPLNWLTMYITNANFTHIKQARAFGFQVPDSNTAILPLRIIYDHVDQEFYVLAGYWQLESDSIGNSTVNFVRFILMRTDTSLNLIELWELIASHNHNDYFSVSHNSINTTIDSAGNIWLLIIPNAVGMINTNKWQISDSFDATIFYLQDNSNQQKDFYVSGCCGFSSLSQQNISVIDITGTIVTPIHRDSILQYFGSTDSIYLSGLNSTYVIKRFDTTIIKNPSPLQLQFLCDTPQYSQIQSAIEPIARNNTFYAHYNPLTQTIHITCPNQCEKITVFSSSGTLLYSTEVKNKQVTLPFSLPPGIYFISTNHEQPIPVLINH